MAMNGDSYPVSFSVDYPDRPLNRMTTLLRIFTIIPIAIVLSAISGGTWEWSYSNGATGVAVGTGGLLFFAPLLMILFRQKYPRWWFDWNLELQRFSSRVAAYLALMDDTYPATDDHQSVHLDYAYPDARELNRWLPLVKWLLAIPHYIVLFVLDIGVIVAVIGAWFAILFTGGYPPGLFHFVEGVFRWHNRVIGYAVTLVTDRYPPFRLAA
jgi:roadblock/LC7 domain-containing protein